MDDVELVREFLVESHENLSRLDHEIIELEKAPRDANLLASIFRTIHTIKGTSGFFSFGAIERITHHAEAILCAARDGVAPLTPAIITLVLEAVDAVNIELAAIEATGAESGRDWSDLVPRLEAAASFAHAPSNPEPAPGRADAFAPPAPQASRAGCEDQESSSPEPNKEGALADSTVRVDVNLLNKLMNLVGELVLARNQILRFNGRQNDSVLNATSQRLDLITTELQEGVMKTRMQPIGIVWNKFPRIVRDMARAAGKRIEIEMDGGLTELDKTIVEAIRDPLTHLVRNACDHGVESPEIRLQRGKPATGKIGFRAFHEGGNVNIEVTDDGAGIDVEQVRGAALRAGKIRPDSAQSLSPREVMNLIFAPGVSTAKKVTSISGRGVGMDVVKTNVEKIGGSVDLSSTPGEGSIIRIRIPLTLAIIPGLVVTSGDERFVIPQASLLELIRLEGERGRSQIEFIHGAAVYRRRGGLLPLAWLNRILGLEPAGGAAPTLPEVVNIVVLQVEDRQFGLIVDSICDTQEIVVKPLGAQLKELKCYAGATIMGDGKVSLILDAGGIAKLAGVNAETRQAASVAASSGPAVGAVIRKLLLFRAGFIDRLAVPLSLVARLEEIPASRIERAGDGLVMQYRDQIIPLARAATFLDASATADALPDPAPVVVFAEGNRRIGLIVDAIVDIVEESVSITRSAGRPGLWGSGVVSGKVTDFLDVHALISSSDREWFNGASHAATVLVADESAFTRDLIRGSLEVAGHRVIDASTPAEAVEKARNNPVDVVAAALDLPGRGAFEILETLGGRMQLAGVPVIALSAHPEVDRELPDIAAFADCVAKFDRARMLQSLDRLARHLEPHPDPARQGEVEEVFHA